MATQSTRRDGQDAAISGALPEWDLADLYPGRDSAELSRDLDAAAAEAKAFRERYQGKLAALSGAELGAAIAAYERLQETLGRIMSYASLVYAGDMSRPRDRPLLSRPCRSGSTRSRPTLLFFTLELNRLDDAELDAKLADPALAHYAPWLRDVRAFRPHQLSDELEKLLHEKSVAGRAAWTRLFDETDGRRCAFRSAARTSPSPRRCTSCPSRDRAVRKRRRSRSARCSARTRGSSR